MESPTIDMGKLVEDWFGSGLRKNLYEMLKVSYHSSLSLIIKNT